jgi:acetyltransferase-like isoleucine patch superfamily enzyme
VKNLSAKPSAYEVFLERSDSAKRRLYGALKARISGAESFGSRPDMRGNVCFEVKGRAVFGDSFVGDGHAGAVSIKVARDATLFVGDRVFMNSGVTIEAWHEVRIGNDVMMAPLASIIDDNRHEIEPGAIRYKGPVVIGNNVWLTRNVSVLPGVSIGDGSVIGANSVVSRDIPPNSFAAGTPARVIRELAIPDGWIRFRRLEA